MAVTEMLPGVIPTAGRTDSHAVGVLAVNGPGLAEATATDCGASGVDVGTGVEKLSCAGVSVMAEVAPTVRVTVTVWLPGLAPVAVKVIVPL